VQRRASQSVRANQKSVEHRSVFSARLVWQPSGCVRARVFLKSDKIIRSNPKETFHGKEKKGIRARRSDFDAALRPPSRTGHARGAQVHGRRILAPKQR